jgi:hypothetical protein
MTQPRFLKLSAFIVALLILGPPACNPCGDVPSHFLVTSIRAENFFYPSGKTLPLQFVAAGTEVQWDHYILNVPFNVEFTASVRGTGSALYATSCIDPGEDGAKTGIKEISVITLSDYNDNYHEGDNLSAIVSVGDDRDIYYSMDEFISLNAPTLFEQEFRIKLLEAPSQDTNSYQFKIELHLLNGEVFTATSEPVTLLK